MKLKLPERLDTIAVFRALQLGDLLCSVPAFRALRHAWPEARITLLGLPWAHDFVSRFRAYFDDFMLFTGFPGLPEQPFDPQATLAFIEQVQERQFDLVLQMHGNGNIINPLLMLFGAHRYAGFYREENYQPDPETFMPYPDEVNPEVLRHLRLMEFLGIPLQGTDLEFSLYPQDHDDFARLNLALRPQGYICIHPGARFVRRQWDVSNFARLGDLAKEHGLEAVITGVESEREITAAVAETMQHTPLDLTGRTTLGALGVLVKDARMVIANDTGISHIATALKTPSTIITLSHDPERWTPLDSSLHAMINGYDEACFDLAVQALHAHVS